MPVDYLRDDETGHLKIVNGDLAYGDSTRQHQRSLLLAHPGAYKQSPLAGVGLRSFLNDEDKTDLLREIRKQFVQDGMSVQALQVTDEGVKVAAQYEE